MHLRSICTLKRSRAIAAIFSSTRPAKTQQAHWPHRGQSAAQGVQRKDRQTLDAKPTRNRVTGRPKLPPLGACSAQRGFKVKLFTAEGKQGQPLARIKQRGGGGA